MNDAYCVKAQQSGWYLIISNFRYDIETINIANSGVDIECGFDLCERNSKTNDILVASGDILAAKTSTAISGICLIDATQ
jgi:hypothetical protein